MNVRSKGAIASAIAEVLETRQLLSSTLKADGTLVVSGTSGNDSVIVALNGTRATSPYRVTTNGTTEAFTRSHVRRISIYTGDGNDSVRIDEQNGTVPVARYAYLGAGNDLYQGGAGRDLVQGGSQKDTLGGAGGNDWLNGQSGADNVTGGAGADLLYGGSHNNVIAGGTGNDSIFGGAGTDSLLGGQGDDQIVGFAGLDRISPSDGSNIPSIPIRVTVRPISGTEARIDWLPTDTASAKFSLDYSTDAGFHFTHAATTRIADSAAYISGLRPGTNYIFRVSAAASDGALAAAPCEGMYTLSEDTSGWYKIINLGAMTTGEASYTGVGALKITDPDDPTSAGLDASGWIFAGSWQGAVYQAISGTATINDTSHTYTFPGSGEFLVDTAKNLHDDNPGNELPDDENLKLIALEDSYETTNIDRDYDDFYWSVGIDYVPLTTFDLQVSTFIKQEWVNDPTSYNSDNYFDRIFEGDDRGRSGAAIFSRSSANYRTRQILSITPFNANDSDGIVDGTVINRTGITKQYDTDTSLDINDHLTAQAKGDNVIDAFEFAWNRNGMLLDIGQASTDRMFVTGTRTGPMIVKYTFDMAANNPLITSPDIDYDLELTIDFSDPKHPTYQLTGSHDGFPCYEFYLNDSLLYSHDSGSQTALSLFPPQEQSVNQSGDLP